MIAKNQKSRLNIFTIFLILGLMIGLLGQTSPVMAAAPVAVDDDFMTNMAQMIDVPAPGVLINDTDRDGDTLTASLDTGPTNGILTLNSDGSFTYTPGAGYMGIDTFTYVANDGTSDSSPATVTIHIGQCMKDACAKVGNCTASDVLVAYVGVEETIDYCTSAEDTGTYIFYIEFIANSSDRYDPTAWIPLNGTDNSEGCYMDFFTPPLQTYTVQTLTSPFYGPYWDSEDDPELGDQCGDIKQGQSTRKVTEEITVQCSGFLDGLITTYLAWDNQLSLDPACVTGGCPGAPSKCSVGETAVEVRLDPIDLSIEKTASGYDDPLSPWEAPGYIEPGETFKYTVTVTNNSPTLASFGYDIYDDLPIWLQYVGPIEPVDPTDSEAVSENYADGGSAVEGGIWNDNMAEFCYGTTAGCDGYGDIIHIREPKDLAVGASRSYSFWVKMWTEPTPGYCTETLDPRCGVDAFVANPDEIINEACVAGVDREDPALTPQVKGNNCDDVPVPTSVKYAYSNTLADKKGITLNWATTNEIDNLGFNIYRSTSPDGEKVKINKTMIPSVGTGSPEGGVYSYFDAKGGKNGVVPAKVYYYWIQDVPATGDPSFYGPVSGSILK